MRGHHKTSGFITGHNKADHSLADQSSAHHSKVQGAVNAHLVREHSRVWCSERAHGEGAQGEEIVIVVGNEEPTDGSGYCLGEISIQLILANYRLFWY